MECVQGLSRNPGTPARLESAVVHSARWFRPRSELRFAANDFSMFIDAFGDVSVAVHSSNWRSALARYTSNGDVRHCAMGLLHSRNRRLLLPVRSILYFDS